jgi:hypothetical protein
MAVADWKPVYQEPEDYGLYLVKVKGQEGSTTARFDHPNGERKTGWYEITSRGFVEIDVTHWDTMPS